MDGLRMQSKGHAVLTFWAFVSTRYQVASYNYVSKNKRIQTKRQERKDGV